MKQFVTLRFDYFSRCDDWCGEPLSLVDFKDAMTDVVNSLRWFASCLAVMNQNLLNPGHGKMSPISSDTELLRV
jgi:hypothetical protein